MGNVLETSSGDLFYTALSKVEELLGKNAIDGRLAMQYAVSLVCAEEVIILYCIILHYYHFHELKLIKEANLPEIGVAELWDHFSAVGVPEIERCQAVKEEACTNPIVNCILSFAEYCQKHKANSEVIIKTYRQLYLSMHFIFRSLK